MVSARRPDECTAPAGQGVGRFTGVTYSPDRSGEFHWTRHAPGGGRLRQVGCN